MSSAKIGNRRIASHASKRHATTKKITPSECMIIDSIVEWIAIEELRDRLMDELNEDTQIKLGDASIASPFTCKSTGIDKGIHLSIQFIV